MSQPPLRDLTFVVEAAAQPLDRILRDHLTGSSWAQVRRLIESGKVSLDGLVVTDPRVCPRTGQTLELRLRTPKRASARAFPVEILYLDAAVVVVDKPAGLSTVPYEDQEPTSLTEIVRQELFRRSKGGVPPLGVVQRLDKFTSGCMVLARSVSAKRELQSQFRAHTVDRRYLAIVSGAMRSQTLRSRLIRDRGDGRRGSASDARSGQLAITHVRALEYLDDATLIECRLETGRTHQIRIHCAEAGHPLLGEKVYAPAASAGDLRQQLHAAELGFRHPHTHRLLSFSVPLPEDMNATLTRLRASRRS
ncbi:MAG: RluA family pseudouridine synthase [Polyangiaceae bacterium]